MTFLNQERKRLQGLEEAQKQAEIELAEAHSKLKESEKESRDAASRVEEAKERTRLMTGSSGLNKIITVN